MLTASTEKWIIAKEDYQLITNSLKNEKALRKEGKDALFINRMTEAEVMEDSEFPWEAVRLNSKVTIRDKVARINYTYTVVLPELADHRKCKVSVFSPIGAALFGRRKGSDTYWQTPNGKRYFVIVAVSQFAKQ